MIVGELLAYLTPAYIAGVLLFLGLTQQIFVRTRYTYQFHKAGGVHAARLAKEPTMTQKDLATKVNEKPSVINDYESGRAIPSQQVLAKLERALGVKLRGKGEFYVQQYLHWYGLFGDDKMLTVG